MTSEPTPRLEPTQQPHDRSIGDEISLVEVATTVLKHWRATVGFPLVLAFLTGIVSLVVRPTYTATTTFVPEATLQGRVPSTLAGIATQFGIPLGSEASKSPKFYAEVVTSRDLMEHVLLSNYVDPRGNEAASDSATLLQILAISGRDSADSLQRGLKKLDRLVSVTVDNQTNIVRLSVDGKYPTLTAAVANKFVEYLNAFNTEHRQSHARERRKFVEQRIAHVEDELRNAEETLRAFYERNRLWQQSPQLVFDEGRLRRQLDIRQEVYLTLRREYETARIEEVNDTPVITVIDAAVPPQERSSPKRKLIVILAMCLGGIAGAFWAFGAEYIEHVRRHQAENYLHLSGVAGQARKDLGRLLSGIIRRGRQP